MQATQTHLRSISTDETVIIGKTNGERTFGRARTILNGIFDQDYSKWNLNVANRNTEPQEVEVMGLVEEGKFDEIYRGQNDNLDTLCLTQSQGVEFVEKHRKWLKAVNQPMFILFKEHGQYMVAFFSLDHKDRIDSRFIPLFDGGNWDTKSKPCFVIPKLPS